VTIAFLPIAGIHLSWDWFVVALEIALTIYSFIAIWLGPMHNRVM
jgi:hypothetical protein